MYREYEVITDYSLEHLKQTVSNRMKEGWQPIGGISVTPYANNPDEYKQDGFDTMMYSQSLVR